jgi:hypothetical protein
MTKDSQLSKKTSKNGELVRGGTGPMSHIVYSAVNGDDAAKAAIRCIVLKLAKAHNCSRPVTMRYDWIET